MVGWSGGVCWARRRRTTRRGTKKSQSDKRTEPVAAAAAAAASSMQRGDPLVVGRVIGDVVDPFVRRVPLRVAYTAREVSNCCELRPSAIVEQPRVEVGGPDMRTFYTLVCMVIGQLAS